MPKISLSIYVNEKKNLLSETLLLFLLFYYLVLITKGDYTIKLRDDDGYPLWSGPNKNGKGYRRGRYLKRQGYNSWGNN